MAASLAVQNGRVQFCFSIYLMFFSELYVKEKGREKQALEERVLKETMPYIDQNPSLVSLKETAPGNLVSFTSKPSCLMFRKNSKNTDIFFIMWTESALYLFIKVNGCVWMSKDQGIRQTGSTHFMQDMRTSELLRWYYKGAVMEKTAALKL